MLDTGEGRQLTILVSSSGYYRSYLNFQYDSECITLSAMQTSSASVSGAVEEFEIVKIEPGDGVAAGRRSLRRAQAVVLACDLHA